MTYTEPLITVLCAIAVLGLFRFRRREGHWLTLLGVLGLVLISWPPIDWVVSLEIWYPIRAYPQIVPEARMKMQCSGRKS